jgi:hypothetical protein
MQRQENYSMKRINYRGRANGWVWILTSVLFLLFGPVQAGSAEDQPGTLEPGLYQTTGGEASARLQPVDGAWEFMLWQGPAESEPGSGFAFLGRILQRSGTSRLAGTWQSMPGSCCPGRGRGEIEAIDTRSFRFIVFSPSLDQAPWPSLPQVVFSKVAELPAVTSLARLVGDWRVSMWYDDLLPGGAPADLVMGNLRLTASQDKAEGIWAGRPGQVQLIPQTSGLELVYKDAAAGFELSASLREQAGGLALSGPFHSTLGQGRLSLVRGGLPAAPAGPQPGAGGDLAGIWVDPRTGNDYFQIKDSPKGFSFTAYGGSLAQPRYLSKGEARRSGPGRFEGSARDVSGYCCGNQARLIFRQISPEELEISSIWWPIGQTDPGMPPTEPYVLQRTQSESTGPAATRPTAGRWPVIQAPRTGLMSVHGGAVKASFTWQPAQNSGVQAHAYTIFSQGGYGRDFDLFIDPQGRLAARIATQAGPLNLVANRGTKPGSVHQAWLTYQAGGGAKLYMDGAIVASAEMAQPWVGSNSPYLVGASRWPGRAFQGDIQRVELYGSAQDPLQPGEPNLVITPPPPGQTESEPAAGQAAAQARPLVRLWNPSRMVHAYSVKPSDIERLQSIGWQRQGPVAGLWEKQMPGSEPLYAFRHRGKGYTILDTSQTPPPGCDALGLMGYLLPQPAEGSVELFELKGDLPDPLRGGSNIDLLYTTSPETVESAREAGYGQAKSLGYVQPVDEPAFSPPVLYSWSGVWRGEGWGRFFIKRQGKDLLMFWYYGRADGPHYYGRYKLSADLKRAEGIAVGRPGKSASYYRHVLEFISGSLQGPRVRLNSWRLAAPLDDGRLVRFAKPKPTTTMLSKQADGLPPNESAETAKALGPPDPAAMLEKALNAARSTGRLLER